VSTVLELKQLTKRFAAHRAVADVSLEVPRGAFFSLLGPSGCGKTTTLRMIAGFEAPDTGEIWLNGARIDALPPYRRNVNTVFQSYALFPHLTVRGNVEFGLHRKKANGIEARVRGVLEQVRLEDKESRMPAQLSGGERQRVALARSLVLEPAVLLLDEPLSALDPQLRKQVRAELKDLQRRVGVTFLFVTHDQEEALSMSDWIAVMHSGAVEQVGTPQDVYQRPKTRFVASFLGVMNWIGGIGLRPEAIRIAREATGGSRRGTVTGSVFLGPVVHVEARLDSGETCVVQIPHDGVTFQPGDIVHLWWNEPDGVSLPE
jgi:ABC-type Fe3+/spermidine/putrescine transport system ATPase subunit